MTGANAPVISVIVETFTVCHEYPADEARQHLANVLDRLHAQGYPKDRTEIIVVFDRTAFDLEGYVRERYPEVRTTLIDHGTYYSMKNRGCDIANGEICALTDGDCIPATDWLERMAEAFERGADVVAGKTRYRPERAFAQTFSVFDFGHVQADREGKASSLLLNNAGFRRSVLAANQLDERARRNGACVELWHRLKRARYDIVYDTRLLVGHGDDFRGLGFITKHLERGFDTVNLLRINKPEMLEGARYMWLGPLVPLGLFATRVRYDFGRLLSNRRDLAVPLYAVPYYYAMSLFLRALEAAGGMIAILKPNYFGEH